MQMKSLMGKLAGFVGARISGALIGFLSQLVLARLLPVEEVGIVLMGMSAAAFISLAANGGYAVLATTQLPKLKAHGRGKAADSFNAVAVTDSAIVYLALCAATWLGVVAFELNEGVKTALIIGCLCAPASLLIRYNSSVAMAARAFKTAYMPDFIFRPAVFLTGLVAASLVGLLHTAWAALAIFVGITYLAAVGQAWFLDQDSIGLRHLRFTRASHANALRKRALALTLVAAAMLAFADIVMLLAGFVLAEKDVAVVGISLRLAAIAGFVLQAGQSLVLSDFTQSYMRRDVATTEVLLKRINLTTMALVIAGLLGTVILGAFALGLFGEDYRQGKWLLVLFMLGQSVRALGGMNQQILSIDGHQMRTLGACVISLSILFCLTILLSGQWGPIGIGYAVVAAELAWMLILAAQASQLCGRRGDIFWVLGRR